MPDGLNATLRRPILLTTDAVGGVWRYTLDLAAGLRQRGVAVTVAVLGPPPSAAQAAEAASVDVSLVDTGLALDWTAADPAALGRSVAALQRLAAGHASVHLHAPAFAGADAWPVPVVAVAHSDVATWWHAVRGGPLPDDFRWRTEATSTGLRAARAVIAPTQAHARAIQAVYGDRRIVVIFNGTGKPSPSGSGLGEGADPAKAVLTAGRLWDEAKNAAALDRVAAALDVPIRAAGPLTGPNGAAVSLPNLHCLGRLDTAGMHRAYAGASVFASLARYEPFGLCVLEAARAGLRLVLSDIPSFRELWDGAASFVADEAALLPALRHALGQPGDGGAQARSQRYTIDRMVDATIGIHARAAAER